MDKGPRTWLRCLVCVWSWVDPWHPPPIHTYTNNNKNNNNCWVIKISNELKKSKTPSTKAENKTQGNINMFQHKWQKLSDTHDAYWGPSLPWAKQCKRLNNLSQSCSFLFKGTFLILGSCYCADFDMRTLWVLVKAKRSVFQVIWPISGNWSSSKQDLVNWVSVKNNEILVSQTHPF